MSNPGQYSYTCVHVCVHACVCQLCCGPGPSSPQGSSGVDALTWRWRSGRVTHGAQSVSFSLQSRPQRGQKSARLYTLLASMHTYTHTYTFMATKLFTVQGSPCETYFF